MIGVREEPQCCEFAEPVDHRLQQRQLREARELQQELSPGGVAAAPR